MPLDAVHPHAVAAGADPITLAVAQGLAGLADAGGATDLDAAEALCAAHLGAGTAGEGLEAMLRLVRRHPRLERPQLLAARLLDRWIGRAAAMPAWCALRDRFPACADAFLVTLRWTVRTRGEAEARAVIERRFPEPPATPDALLLRARAWDEAGDPRRAARDFIGLSRRDRADEVGHLLHARMLERRGDPWLARRRLSAGLRRRGTSARLTAEAARLDGDLGLLAAVPAAAPGTPADIGSRVLAHLLLRAILRRGTPRPERYALGSVLMVNGSLGAGGAERQLVNTALGLQDALVAGRPLAGCRLDGPIRVVVRSLDDRPGGDFFLPALRARGIPVGRYDRFPPFVGDRAGPVPAADRDLLRFLPPRVAEGTLRLADAFRAAAPSVVHLWQDGTILAGALAALLAGVPRIVLSVRSAPPPDRPERDRPEYAALYPLLARAPGVVMTANSRFAAARYADWIGLPSGQIRVVPNGLSLPSADASESGHALLSAFTTLTGPGFTVGGVMRLDDNKRPLAWIDCAARVHARRPDARFILVGEGELRDAAEARARALGIGDRVLFTGRRADVGFWLRQLDAFLLLSRCEGLPNVLIEAQAAGVPVVTTPAGGAAETLLHGDTGWVLGSAAAPDLDEAAARLVALAADPTCPKARSARARRLVAERFSLHRMIQQTMESYLD